MTNLDRSNSVRPCVARGLAGVALAALVAAPLAGCRGDRTDKPPRQFFPGMDDQPKYEPQDKSYFFREYAGKKETDKPWGRAARLPVEGAVPFGRQPIADPVVFNNVSYDFANRASMLRGSDAIFEGLTPGGDVIDTIPIPVTPALLALGETKYNTYCIVCHGGTGAGDGLVGLQWSYPLPNFHDATYQKDGGDPKGRDGHLFRTIRYGVQAVGQPWEYAMQPYGSKVDEQESWAIVAYIRALQQTRRGTLDMLPTPDAERLRRERPRTSPAGGGGESNGSAGGGATGESMSQPMGQGGAG
jgi:mono/diheme cytochrome c family protein